MAVRTARLAVGRSSGGGTSETIYTCPGGVTAILKDVRLVNLGATTSPYHLLAVSGPTGVSLQISDLGSLKTASMQPWFVLEPGDSLELAVTGNNIFTYWLSGSELAGVAP